MGELWITEGEALVAMQALKEERWDLIYIDPPLLYAEEPGKLRRSVGFT